MSITDRDVCSCSFAAIFHHVGYLEDKNQSFPYGAFMYILKQYRVNLEEGVRIMKKSYSVIRFIVVLMMVAAFLACASTPKQSSTGEYIDDSVITTKVKTLLAEDNFLKSFKISVETYKGTVQLSGTVASQNAVDQAGQIARGVEGVKSVRNDLIVK
jgi:hypothetical protein